MGNLKVFNLCKMTSEVMAMKHLFIAPTTKQLGAHTAKYTNNRPPQIN